MRLLGIDYGAKRIGVALGDTETRIASPWRVLENTGTSDAVAELTRIMAAEGAAEVVVGMPATLSGEERGQADVTRAFIKALRDGGVIVHEADERLSSKLADTHAADAGRRRGPRDDLAAAAILQTWLEQYGVSS